MIDEEATKKRYGYYSMELSPKSDKKIIAVCEGCGKERELQKHNYRALCGSCAQKVEKIKCKCSQCGKEFEVFPSGFKRGEGKFCSKDCFSKHIVGEGNPFYGRIHSDETRIKISENHYDCSRENHPNWRGGKIKRICHECGKVFYVDQYKIKKGEGKYCSHVCNYKNIKFRRHHTKPELIFEKICKKNDISFHYVGDCQLWIGKKNGTQLNPDFIEANGKKVLVEIMGDYWHSPLLNRNIKIRATLGFRKRHYKRFKWHSIFIWETDLKREDAEAFVLKILGEV